MEENVFAAYLAHPRLNIPELYENLNSRAFLKNMYDFLKINKVLMKTLSYVDSTENLSKKAIILQLIGNSGLFHDAHVFMVNLIHELLNIIEVLNTNGIKTMFIKSTNSLPLDSDNFDILVEESNLAKSIQALLNLGFIEVVKAREPYKLLFRKVKDGKDYLALHLHTRVAWEGIEFIDLNELWNRRKKIKIDKTVIYVPSYEDSLLITTAHLFFENHNFKLEDLIRFVEIFHNCQNIDWDYITRSVKNEKWTLPFCIILILSDKLHYNLYSRRLMDDDLLNDILKKCDINRQRVERIVKRLVNRFWQRQTLPLRLPIALVAQQYFSKILRDERISINKKFKIIYSMLDGFFKRKLALQKPGYKELICFIGIDGSGKTTHAKLLAKELSRRKVKSKYIWTRGSPLFLRPLVSLLKHLAKIREPSANTEISLSKKFLSKEPYMTLWTTLLLVDHLTQILIKVRLPLMLGQTIICDRYIYDTFVDVKCRFQKSYEETIIGKVVNKILPKPDIVFITDSIPTEILKRRPDENDEELLNLKRLQYLSYHIRESNFFILDTLNHINENKRKALSLALAKYYSGNLTSSRVSKPSNSVSYGDIDNERHCSVLYSWL